MKKFYFSFSLIIVLLLNVFIPVYGGTYTVTSNISGTTTDGISLRWAITQANANSGPDSITFNIAGTPPHVIAITSILPALTGSDGAGTIIDGTTQPNNGFAGISPKIIIDGAGGSIQSGLSLQAGNCEVYGLMITNFPAIWAAGIQVFSSGSNFIIGAPGKGNVISNMGAAFGTGAGITITSGVNGGKIQGNKVGTDTTGTISQSTYIGINIEDLTGTNPVRNILIGGAGAGEGNLISGQVGANSENIFIRASKQIIIKGNIIGPSINGTTKLIGNNVNTNVGIYLFSGADSCIIGGSLPGEGNIIAYNEDSTNHIGGAIEVQSSRYNLISRNSIFCNGSWGGIQLISGNDNYLAPVINSANTAGAAGTASPNAIVELFYNHTGCTHAPHGCSGMTYIGTTTADNAGNWSYTGAIGMGSLTATATDPTNNNTSLFSNCNLVVASLPVASFQSSDTTFCDEGGKCINFFDYSSGNPTSWQWSFPGANATTSSVKNPTNICYATPGTYAVTLIVTNSAGKDTLTVSPMIIFSSGPAVPSITLTGGDTLVCSAASSYQWFFNGSPISGATDSFYVAISDGTYNVSVTDSLGCSRLGSGVSFTAVGLVVNPDLQFAVYPNPASNQFTVYGLQFTVGVTIEIFNVFGGKVFSQYSILNSHYFDIDVSSFSAGVYFIRINDGRETVNQKVIIEK